MKLIFSLFLFFGVICASKLKEPVLKYISSGAVVDMVVANNRLYVATNVGYVDVFDIKTAKLLQKLEISKIEDFMGDMINSKVYSVDMMDEKTLVLSQANKGSRRVHIYKEGKLDLLISGKDQLYISKARFLNKDTLILGLLGNEIISYDINEKKINWRVQVSHSKFSDFAFNDKKDEVVVADESGDLKILSVKDGSLLEILGGQNLDNVFQVDYKSSKIATAGQDRRVVIYDRDLGSAYYKSSSFLIYSVGLSPSGNIVGFASDENNNVTVFNTSTKESLGSFGGNKMTLTKIIFLNESEFLVSSDDKVINLFKIKIYNKD